MPWKPKTPCQRPGCPELCYEPYCEEHRLERERPRRKIQKKLYNRRWEKMRALFLRQHPLCVHCAKAERVTTATEVDHIIPHRGKRQRFWDQSNWQPLCKSCHSRKTAVESGWTHQTPTGHKDH